MRVSVDFNNVKDADLVMKFKAMGRGVKKNVKVFQKPPFDLDQFLSLVDDYNQAVVAAKDRSRAAIAQRNKLRKEATKQATLLGHYVGHIAGNDLKIVYAGGCEPAQKYRLLPQPIPKPRMGKVVRGPNSGTALAYIIPISRAKYGKVANYELGYAILNGNDIGDLTLVPTTVARFPIAIKNLTPGTTYIFKARALSKDNKQGFTDWSDPYPYMAT
jgi:hypothetical protein